MHIIYTMSLFSTDTFGRKTASGGITVGWI